MSAIPEIPSEGLFLHEEGWTKGPVSLSEVESLFENGKINRTTFLWFEGLSNWITVGDIPTFNRRTVVVPPLPESEEGGTDLWVYDSRQEKIVPVQKTEDVTQMRRSDLIYSNEAKDWVRLDQDSRTQQQFKPAPTPIELETPSEETPMRLTKQEIEQSSPLSRLSPGWFLVAILVSVSLFFLLKGL